MFQMPQPIFQRLALGCSNQVPGKTARQRLLSGKLPGTQALFDIHAHDTVLMVVRKKQLASRDAVCFIIGQARP